MQILATMSAVPILITAKKTLTSILGAVHLHVCTEVFTFAKSTTADWQIYVHLIFERKKEMQSDVFFLYTQAWKCYIKFFNLLADEYRHSFIEFTWHKFPVPCFFFAWALFSTMSNNKFEENLENGSGNHISRCVMCK